MDLFNIGRYMQLHQIDTETRIIHKRLVYIISFAMRTVPNFRCIESAVHD